MRRSHLLRLPAGLFYARGVKANVLFFDKKPASETRGPASCGSTTCAPIGTSPLKTNPLKREDLDDFVKCYVPEARASGGRQPGLNKCPLGPLPGERGLVARGRWRACYEELIKRDKASLDIFWLKRMSRWRIQTTCRNQASSRPRSSRICRRHWNGFM